MMNIATTEPGMKEYMVRREIAGAGRIALSNWNQTMVDESQPVLDQIGGIEWRGTTVCHHTAFCSFLATDADKVRQHSELLGLPFDAIYEVVRRVETASAHGRLRDAG